MRAQVGLLLTAVLVTARTNHSNEELCVEAVLSRVHITMDKLPVSLLATTKHLSQVLRPRDFEQWSRNVLEMESEVLSIGLVMANGSTVINYRMEMGSTSVVNNATSPSYVRELATTWNKTGPGFWSFPFWDCVLHKWIFGYSSLLKESSGVAGLFYPLDRVELNQCDDVFSPLFGGGHMCDPLTTTCVPVYGYGLKGGGYRCACLPGFTSPVSLKTNGSEETRQQQFGSQMFYRCISPCGEGHICKTQPDLFLRTMLLCAQLSCMVVTFILAIIVFRKRKCKTIASGMWTILETILLGIFLLYCSVLVHIYEPSVERCLFEPWFRELGFIICYGAIILKLYRILMEFRTRKAHRWVVRDKDLLKYLLGMVLIMLAYLAAWTATNLNFQREGFSLLTVGQTFSGLHFQACKPLWWDYITEAGELLILLFGLHLGLVTRNASVQFEERCFLCCTVGVEAVVSCVFYIVRALYWDSLHPDHAFLAAVLRSQLTNTTVLMLIFTPKLWYQHKQVRDSQHHLTHEPSDAYKPQDGSIHCPDLDSEVSLADMNPEDIRAELKRLYTQLQVLKNKTIRQNNPHISKRRGGRKVAHRRFSLQVLQRRQQKRENHGGEAAEVAETELSRTPEESVCSVDGPSAIYNDGPSTYSELGGFGTPNIPHRASNKH